MASHSAPSSPQSAFVAPSSSASKTKALRGDEKDENDVDDSADDDDDSDDDNDDSDDDGDKEDDGDDDARAASSPLDGGAPRVARPRPQRRVICAVVLSPWKVCHDVS